MGVCGVWSTKQSKLFPPAEIKGKIEESLNKEQFTTFNLYPQEEIATMNKQYIVVVRDPENDTIKKIVFTHDATQQFGSIPEQFEPLSFEREGKGIIDMLLKNDISGAEEIVANIVPEDLREEHTISYVLKWEQKLKSSHKISGEVGGLIIRPSYLPIMKLGQTHNVSLMRVVNMENSQTTFRCRNLYMMKNGTETPIRSLSVEEGSNKRRRLE